ADALDDIVGGVADDIVEMLHRTAAPAQFGGIFLDPLEHLVLVEQFLVRLDLGAGQQGGGIEVAGELGVEPAHRQVPHLLLVPGRDGDVGLVTGDRPELAPVALLAGVLLPHLRRGTRSRMRLHASARSRAAAIGDAAHQALPLVSDSRGAVGGASRTGPAERAGSVRSGGPIVATVPVHPLVNGHFLGAADPARYPHLWQVAHSKMVVITAARLSVLRRRPRNVCSWSSRLARSSRLRFTPSRICAARSGSSA